MYLRVYEVGAIFEIPIKLFRVESMYFFLCSCEIQFELQLFIQFERNF